MSDMKSRATAAQRARDPTCEECDEQPLVASPAIRPVAAAVAALGIAIAFGVGYQVRTSVRLLPFNVRVRLVGGVAAVIIFLTLVRTVHAFFRPSLRLSQPLSYHNFADKRRWCCGMPNSSDVLSNAPFLFGAYPASLLLYAGGADSPRFHDSRESAAWLVTFIGIVWVAGGSAYYHLKPANSTLVWDRLPMTVGFMGLTSALISETISVDLGATLLPYLVATGALSVAYWSATDDLTPYACVQFLPMLLLPLLLLAFEPRYSHNEFYVLALACYAAAKVTEAKDREIYVCTRRVVSGHTAKHLLAAAATTVFAAQLSARSPLP